MHMHDHSEAKQAWFSLCRNGCFLSPEIFNLYMSTYALCFLALFGSQKHQESKAYLSGWIRRAALSGQGEGLDGRNRAILSAGQATKMFSMALGLFVLHPFND